MNYSVLRVSMTTVATMTVAVATTMTTTTNGGGRGGEEDWGTPHTRKTIPALGPAECAKRLNTAGELQLNCAVLTLQLKMLLICYAGYSAANLLGGIGPAHSAAWMPGNESFRPPVTL